MRPQCSIRFFCFLFVSHLNFPVVNSPPRRPRRRRHRHGRHLAWTDFGRRAADQGTGGGGPGRSQDLRQEQRGAQRAEHDRAQGPNVSKSFTTVYNRFL